MGDYVRTSKAYDIDRRVVFGTTTKQACNTVPVILRG